MAYRINLRRRRRRRGWPRPRKRQIRKSLPETCPPMKEDFEGWMAYRNTSGGSCAR